MITTTATIGKAGRREENLSLQLKPLIGGPTDLNRIAIPMIRIA